MINLIIYLLIVIGYPIYALSLHFDGSAEPYHYVFFGMVAHIWLATIINIITSIRVVNRDE